jgi:ankyrin repeat protein
VLKLETDLEKGLFKRSFEGNEISKVVVMVDGFDEISPSYKDTVLNILQVLKQTSLEQLWVTTRPHLREELEDNMQQLSYTLQPFSVFEQVEFLKKFWLHSLNFQVSNQSLQIYAEALITKLAQSISDKDKEFTGIPLQTRMLAEAFEEKSETELTHKLDFLGLYRRFIDRKYDIYYREKLKTPEGNMAAEEQRRRDLKYIQSEHQVLAILALFTEEQITTLQIDHLSTFSDDELARIGIVHRNNDGKPQFIHRTFAEYFVAEIVIKQLTNKMKQQNVLLNIVLLQADYQVTRRFLNGMLENIRRSTLVLKEYGKKLDERWNEGEVHRTLKGVTTELHTAAVEDNANIVGILLDSLTSGKYSTATKKMLLAVDNSGRTAWHMATEENSVQALNIIWEWAKAVAPTLTRSLLLSQDIYSRNAWQNAAARGHVEVLEKLWNLAKELQLKPEELRVEVLLSKDASEQTIFHTAAERGNIEVLDKLWNWAKELSLKPEELTYEVLLSKDVSEQTIWHMATVRGDVEVLGKLWNWTEELQLKPEELRREVWLSRDKYKETAWHGAAAEGHVEVLEKLWNWAKELHIKPEELRDEVLLLKNVSEQTIWYMAAERGHFGVLEKLWSWAKELQLKPEDLKNEVLLLKDVSEQTIWHMAAQRGDVEVLEKLWNWAKELQLESGELRNDVFLSKDKYAKTAWHTAAAEGHVEVLEKLWNWAKELQLKPEQLRDEVLLLKDVSEQTIWHMAAQRGDVEVLEKLWNWAKELQLKPEELTNKVLLSKDKYKLTAWHRAATEGYVEVLEKLREWAIELQLKPEELTNEALSKDVSEQTI